jgi:endo-1,4-beta-xylanase
MRSATAAHLLCRAVLIAFACTSPAAALPDAIPLWPNNTPGSEGKTAPETVRLTPQGEHIVSQVNRPSIIPYLPLGKGKTHTAIIVVPGGGHRELWMDHEGYRVGQWLSGRDIAAFVLKYRLAKEDGSTYTVEGTELSDLRRAIRLVRSRAAEWHIAPDRIGVIGFSAGGELAALAGTRRDDALLNASDVVDRERGAPDFMALIYPAIPQGIAVNKATPPTFLLCGEDDGPAISQGVAELYLAYKQAGASAELHILSGAGHGFGIRADNPPGIANWTQLFYLWLDTRGLLKRP